MDSDDSNYDSFGNSDATQGEIYTNQYDGIDGIAMTTKGEHNVRMKDLGKDQSFAQNYSHRIKILMIEYSQVLSRLCSLLSFAQHY